MIKKIILGFVLAFTAFATFVIGSLLVESWTDIDLPWISTETTITNVQVETRI